MAISNDFDINLKQSLGEKLITLLRKKKLSEPEILAVRDTKLIEAIC